MKLCLNQRVHTGSAVVVEVRGNFKSAAATSSRASISQDKAINVKEQAQIFQK